jgi:hypothetical protein
MSGHKRQKIPNLVPITTEFFLFVGWEVVSPYSSTLFPTITTLSYGYDLTIFLYNTCHAAYPLPSARESIRDVSRKNLTEEGSGISR